MYLHICGVKGKKPFIVSVTAVQFILWLLWVSARINVEVKQRRREMLKTQRLLCVTAVHRAESERATGSTGRPTKSLRTSPLKYLTSYCCNNWRKQVHRGAFPPWQCVERALRSRACLAHFAFEALLFMNFLLSPLKKCAKFSCWSWQ